MNAYINLTEENISDEHICCAIGDPKHNSGVIMKKQWLSERIAQGHVFRKLDARGKIFIEYAPLESAWVPVSGAEYMYIYCLWVAGSFKGKGYASELLEYAINDSKNKGKSGICTLSSKKKKPFLSEKSFFTHYGFSVADSVGEYELLSFSWDGTQPHFNDCVRSMEIDTNIFTVYYSPECPYVLNSIKELEEYASDSGIPFNAVKIDSLEKAKSVPCVFNNWANFKNGKFISNTILNKNSFEKLLNK